MEIDPEIRVPYTEDRTFPITLLIVTVVLALGAGCIYWYHAWQKSDFSPIYAQLGIQPLPITVELQSKIQARLEQLSREACYRDAIVALGEALLDEGYPREAAISLRSFAKRCGSVQEIVPLAYEALERISDFVGALEVANELVNAAPINGTFRYWRAIAYEQTENYPKALTDYINSIQLVGDLKDVSGDAFYKLSRVYAALGRPCDAITPLETYISLEPAKRRTPQVAKIIADYAKTGNCDAHYARGTARMPFVGASDVHTLSVVINGILGNFLLDTGATFVTVRSQFAARAKVSIESGNQVSMKTVGGRAVADIGYANSVSVGDAKASGVVIAVHQGDDNPFGDQLDGLLGMSFLSRFKLNVSPMGIELAAIPLR
jgi:tetratricopeptide (TPR) repeat protein